MEETQQLELSIRDESKQGVGAPNQRLSLPKKMNVSRWIRVCVYTILLPVGQSVATVLGRLYFDKGGKSKWLEALVTLIGFPVLIPLYFLLPITKTSTHYANNEKNPPSFAKISSIYIGLGILVPSVPKPAKEKPATTNQRKLATNNQQNRLQTTGENQQQKPKNSEIQQRQPNAHTVRLVSQVIEQAAPKALKTSLGMEGKRSGDAEKQTLHEEGGGTAKPNGRPPAED